MLNTSPLVWVTCLGSHFFFFFFLHDPCRVLPIRHLCSKSAHLKLTTCNFYETLKILINTHHRSFQELFRAEPSQQEDSNHQTERAAGEGEVQSGVMTVVTVDHCGLGVLSPLQDLLLIFLVLVIPIQIVLVIPNATRKS